MSTLLQIGKINRGIGMDVDFRTIAAEHDNVMVFSRYHSVSLSN
jgi:hypothetical protein